MNAKETILITGASGGLGLDWVNLAAQDKHDLILVARTEKKLKEVQSEVMSKYGVKVGVYATDLSLPTAAEDLYAAVKKDGWNVTILINNAGFGDSGLFSETDKEKEAEMIQLNISTLTRLSKLFIKDMVKADHGQIVNIASMAGLIPGPYMAVYYATKAYVISLTEALADELKGTGVSATVVCPGPTNTNFMATANADGTQLYKGMFNVVMESGDAARIAYAGIKKKKSFVPLGLYNAMGAMSLGFFPRSVRTYMGRFLNKK